METAITTNNLRRVMDSVPRLRVNGAEEGDLALFLRLYGAKNESKVAEDCEKVHADDAPTTKEAISVIGREGVVAWVKSLIMDLAAVTNNADRINVNTASRMADVMLSKYGKTLNVREWLEFFYLLESGEFGDVYVANVISVMAALTEYVTGHRAKALQRQETQRIEPTSERRGGIGELRAYFDDLRAKGEQPHNELFIRDFAANIFGEEAANL